MLEREEEAQPREDHAKEEDVRVAGLPRGGLGWRVRLGVEGGGEEERALTRALLSSWDVRRTGWN